MNTIDMSVRCDSCGKHTGLDTGCCGECAGDYNEPDRAAGLRRVNRRRVSNGLEPHPVDVTVRLDVPMKDIDLSTHSLTGWPHKTTCECGARAVLLCATIYDASYECRGTPHGTSDYGDDRCGRVFSVESERSGR